MSLVGIPPAEKPEQDSLREFVERCAKPDHVWVAKRLSGNDTGLTGAHQVGVYLPRRFFELTLPGWSLDSLDEVYLPVAVPSHDEPETLVRVVWYASKTEGRITQWRKGSVRDRALFDPENTGALTVLAFRATLGCERPDHLVMWIARSPSEEDLLEGITGPVEPGQTLVFRPGESTTTDRLPPPRACVFDLENLLEQWGGDLPDTRSVVEAAVRACTVRGNADRRLVARRACEYTLFRAVEEHLVLPRIQAGFDDVDAFVQYANRITNRRKSRAGRSLEHHLAIVFCESGLSFDEQARTEDAHRPDFLFPPGRYSDNTWPDSRLRMLAVKTTCKDRWRQVLTEARRIERKHLFTLQEGISEKQWTQMQQEGVQLVVPDSIHRSYPKSVQPELLSLERFISETASL